MAWFDLFGESKDVCYNRKEAKDHGEGGVLVGAAVAHRRVLIVDDVITAGTAIREAVALLSAESTDAATVVGVAVSLDRQETRETAPAPGSEEATSSSSSSNTARRSATQNVEEELGIPVVSIVCLHHLVDFVQSEAASGQCSGSGGSSNGSSGGSSGLDPELLVRIEEYRAMYGVVYENPDA